ncbi:MAG: MerR family transcriptional regulator [Candidatus Cloacimonadaceae bacterium]|nr:MerR family transcriptional regulator [Candidatus Cloacimonadaceae bacterium]MDP3113996.1 MerR family transcriptional regulator [Candidatus Cloacimonadaceae bacterium]
MKKHFYTIGEVSNLLDLRPSVIRFWETEFSFIRPRREERRIRKYDEPTIQMLKRIKDMLYNQRFTIEGARQKLKAERRSARKGEPVSETIESPVPKQTAPIADNTAKQLLGELREKLLSIKIQCEQLKRNT